MTRHWKLLVGLPLVLASAVSARAASDSVPTFGTGPAYEAIGRLPVMHSGRKKPFDTLAREEIKQIFGRETIKLLDLSRETDHLFRPKAGAPEKVAAYWTPVAALFDWSIRPEFWDEQPIILVDYLPLRRMILADALKTRLTAIADSADTSAEDRAAAKALASEKEISSPALIKFLGNTKLSTADRTAVEQFAVQFGEEHKWLTPQQLEEAQLTVDDRRISFSTWFDGLVQRKRSSDEGMGPDTAKLNEVERRAHEAGSRLVHYHAIRDRAIDSVEPLLTFPRPDNDAYLAFCADALKKIQEQKGFHASTPLEIDAAHVLMTYEKSLPGDEREIPGKDASFDKSFKGWLKNNSVWVPLRAFLTAPAGELKKAGFPVDESGAFLAAFKQTEQAEDSEPGKLSEKKAAGLLSAARKLGTAINAKEYPTTTEMDREAYFNATNPFFVAPWAYFGGAALLAISLGVVPNERKSATWWLGLSVYAFGIACLVGGIVLEIIGFYLRIRITGWAPVTNMYETVIWVSLVSAVLGLVFEMIFRKTFAALAGSGVALLGTVLAANVPLLDPGIHSLQPVLRSNFWLAIHVLTEVSSYAAFALAMGLGIIATLYYLTATYRRSPRFMELGAPALPGLPLLCVGSVGLAMSYGAFGISMSADRATLLYYVASALAAVGGFATIVGFGALFGEVVSRITFRGKDALPASTAPSSDGGDIGPAATSVQTVRVSESEGAVATLTKPTVAEIRARAALTRPQLDARGLAMQSTAAKIKPLSNFIYRTMQVGVLLVAAGTILGGIWADYSWGRFWGWDPKEVWALITLLVYLIPLHGRFAGWVNTFGLVIASVVCFLSVVMAWYGVNFVLGVGLHSYGFVEGGSQGVVGAVILAVLAVPGAAAWRRSLASRIA